MVNEYSNNSIRLQIQPFHNRASIDYIIIDKNNINTYIKPISNISVFLCDTNKFLYLENKKILM